MMWRRFGAVHPVPPINWVQREVTVSLEHEELRNVTVEGRYFRSPFSSPFDSVCCWPWLERGSLSERALLRGVLVTAPAGVCRRRRAAVPGQHRH